MTPESTISTQTALITGLSALAGIVALFWRIIHNAHEKAIAELDECQRKHEESDQKIVEISSRVAYLEGQQDGVKGFAQKVLDIVHQKTHSNQPNA